MGGRNGVRGKKVEGRMNKEEEESSRRGVVYSEYTVGAI